MQEAADGQFVPGNPEDSLPMYNANTFKTKTGFCHVLPGKIILTRDGAVGNMARVAVGGNNFRILAIYSIIAIGLLYFSYDSFHQRHITRAIPLSLFASYLIYGIATSMNNSAALVIERQRIRQVRFKKAIPGLTRSRFEVTFRDGNDRIKKRLIILPGSLSGGQSHTERAIKIMEVEKLITA